VIAYARCTEDCTVAMSARMLIGRRSYRLGRVTRAARGGRRVTLRIRLTPRSARAVRRALRGRRRARVRVALRGRDRAGNRSPLVRARVRLRR